MTIGPAPMMRMERISLRLGIISLCCGIRCCESPPPLRGRAGVGGNAPLSPRLFHHRDEPSEEIVAVPRSRARLGMVLHGKDLLPFDAQPLVAAVEQRDMGR